MVALQILPFDAHNHVQLGPPPPLLSSPSELRRELPEIRIRKSSESLQDNEISNIGIGNAISNGEEQNNDDSDEGINKTHSSFLVRSLGEYIRRELRGKHISGMAMMATHPRDFSTLLDLEREFSNTGESARFSTTDELTLLPCIGVHPWFLHELNPDEDWIMVPSPQLKAAGTNSEASMIVSPPEETVPKWIANIESLLIENPHLPVGEIGLDNFHFDPVTKELTTSIELQIEALKLQLRVATKYHRPVSLHCVRAMGPLMDSLEEIAEENYQRLSERWNDNDEVLLCEGSSVSLENHVLPPRLYFHAFGGKAGTATQLIKTLEKPRRIKIRNDIVKRTTKKKIRVCCSTQGLLWFCSTR